ncbi:MAG: hypothetical protein C4555_04385 [Dehalococcoidia bacterium]|nr:MAG: hypothetical protein C4555_04385 [Dehalococcoidia bacterium]
MDDYYKRVLRMFATGDPGWTPASLGASLTGWFDAQDGSTFIFNGSSVASWGNKGSAGGAATNGTAAQQPAYDATGLNGRPCVKWSVIPQFLTSIVPTGVATFTVLAVVMHTYAASKFLFSATIGSGWRVQLTTAGAAQLFGSLSTTASDAGALSDAVLVVYRCVYDATKAYHFVNGVDKNGGVGTTANGGGDLILGRSNTFLGPAALGELLWYAGVMSAPDIALAEAYLTAKWGI